MQSCRNDDCLWLSFCSSCLVGLFFGIRRAMSKLTVVILAISTLANFPGVAFRTRLARFVYQEYFLRLDRKHKGWLVLPHRRAHRHALNGFLKAVVMHERSRKRSMLDNNLKCETMDFKAVRKQWSNKGRVRQAAS